MAQQRIERRLAASVAVDVAGYSRLMGRDEEGTLAALRAIRRELSDPKIRERQGRIVKTMGDGLLIEFTSAVGAGRSSPSPRPSPRSRGEGGRLRWTRRAHTDPLPLAGRGSRGAAAAGEGPQPVSAAPACRRNDLGSSCYSVPQPGSFARIVIGGLDPRISEMAGSSPATTAIEGKPA